MNTTEQLKSVGALGYLGVGIKDMSAWKGFVTGVLGFQWGDECSDGSRWVRMDDHRRRLILTPTGEDDVVFVGWEVASAGGLKDAEARLQGAGVKVARGSEELARQRGVQELICCNDCDGLATEIYYGPPIDVRNIFMPSQPVGGFKTDHLGLGHIVLTTPDETRAERFYREALGFRLTDYINLQLAPGLHTRATFMRCNARHHSVAFVKAPIPKRLLHFMAEVHELDEVGLACERARAAAVPLAATLGRHSNDRMVSFYMTSPSGFEVEYGFGGRLIDEATWRVEVFDKAEIWGHERRGHG
jgi:2,3-dihydroxybiphenyl 1,2-dioxygenase